MIAPSNLTVFRATCGGTRHRDRTSSIVCLTCFGLKTRTKAFLLRPTGQPESP